MPLKLKVMYKKVYTKLTKLRILKHDIIVEMRKTIFSEKIFTALSRAKSDWPCVFLQQLFAAESFQNSRVRINAF